MPTSRAGGSSRSILREAAFVRLWTGTTASGLATWALPFVLGLGVLERELSAAGLGVVPAARTAGFLAAVPVAGVLADRHSRRGVVAWAGLAAAAGALVIALGLGWSVPLMAVAAAVVGAGQGACRPAYQALVAEVVDAERRQTANAAMALAVRTTTLVAPGLTALLAVWLDTRALLIGTGLAALTAVIATGYSATGVALPLISRDRYDTEAVLAAAMTAYTVGGLLGALVIVRWRPRAEGWAALAALGCYGFAPLALLLPVHWVVIVAAYVVAGLGIELFNVPWFTATQREVDPAAAALVPSTRAFTRSTEGAVR